MDSFSSAGFDGTNSFELLDVETNAGSELEAPMTTFTIEDTLGEVTDTLSGLLDQFNEAKSTVEDLNNDIRGYLTVLQTGLDAQILSRSLPLIGDNLEDAADGAVQFLDDLNNRVTAQLLRLDGIGNLSAERVRQVLVEVLVEQGSLAVEKLLPEAVSDPFVSTLQGALTGEQSIEEGLRSALETALAELEQSGLLNGVLPDDVGDLLNANVVKEILLELGETALAQIDAEQLQQGLVEAIASLGIVNLAEFIPDTVLSQLQSNVAAALSSGSFNQMTAAVETALSDLSGQLSNVPTAAEVLAAAELNAENFDQLGAGATLQRLFAGLNQLEAFDLEAILPADELLSTFKGQLDTDVSMPEALRSLLGTFQSTFPQLLSTVPNTEALLSAAVPALINEQLESLSAGEIEAVFSAQQGIQGLLIAVSELDLFSLDALLPDDVINNVTDQFQTLLSEGSSVSDALGAGLEQALVALSESGLLSATLPALEDLQREILPFIDGDQIEQLTAEQFRSLLFEGLTALEELSVSDVNEFISVETAERLLQAFTDGIAGDAVNIPAALEQTLTAALAEPEVLQVLAGELPGVNDLVKGLIPEFSSILNGGLGGFLTQIAGIEGITNLSGEAIFQALMVTLVEVGALDAVPELGDEAIATLTRDLVTTFENQLSNGGSLTDALVSGLEQAFLALDALEVFPLGDLTDISASFQNELLPRLSAIDLDALTADSFRGILLDAAEAFGGLALPAFLPPEVASDLFNLTQVELQEASFTDALNTSLDRILPTLQGLGALDALPDSAEVVTRTLLDLGEADLSALAAEQLQQSLFNAAIRGLNGFDLQAFAPNVSNLFNNVADPADLKVQVSAALDQLQSLGLLSETVSVEAVLNAAKLRLGTQELSELPAAALAERLLTGLNELEALNLDSLLSLDQAQTLIGEFQSQLGQGAALLEALESLAGQAQSVLNADLFAGGVPDVEALFAAALPELVAAQLRSLTAGELQSSVLSALNQLEALNLSRFLSDDTAQALFNTFNGAQPDVDLASAIGETLTDAVSRPEFLGAIAGNIPAVEDVLQGFITELTPGLDSLSGFLDRLLTPALSGINAALFEALGQSGLDLLPNDLPSADDISAQVPKILLNAVLRGATDGDIAGALQTALADALGPLGLNILERGEALAEDVQEQILQEVQTRLADPLGGLLGIDTLLDQALDDLFGADVVDVSLENDMLSFDLTISESAGLEDVALDAEVGLPGLGLETQGSLDVGANFNADLGFGFDLNQRELFIDTASAEELRLELAATLEALEADATLGYLQLDVETNDNPNGLDLGFGIDLSDAEGDNNGQLTLSELSTAAIAELIDPIIGGRFDLNLALSTNFDGSPLLPGISADFSLGAALDGLDIDEAFDSANIAFNDIQLNLGTFLQNFVKKILDSVQVITEPLQPLVDIINQDVPVINASFLDLVQIPEFQQVADEQVAGSVAFIEAIVNIVELLELVNAADGEDAIIDLGSFQIAGVALQDEETGTSSAQIFLLPNSLAAGGAGALDFGEPEPSEPGTNPLDQLKSAVGEIGENLEENSLFEFPILTDPSAIAKLLIGSDETFDLFRLSPPPLQIGFEYKQTIPIVGPIAAVVGGAAGAAAAIEFGYDNFGLQQFRDSGFTSPSFLTEGLFVKTPDLDDSFDLPSPLPQDEIHTVGVAAGIGVGVGIELGAVSADVTAELIGGAFLDFADPNASGSAEVPIKIRIEDLANPGCIFEVSGRLDAALAATLKVGFGPFSYKKRFEILRQTLADARTDFCHKDAEREDRGQATLEDDGTLVLTTTGDRDEIFVEHLSGEAGAETVDVIARVLNDDGLSESVPFSYENVVRIEAEGKDGDDFIQLADGVLSPATLRGNDGDDNIRGGDGDDLIEGNADSDVLDGGRGDDEISGGSGDDFVTGGLGNDTLDGGESENDFDSVSYANASSAVNISLRAGETSTDGDGGVDTLINFERIEGSRFDDSLTGDNEANVLDGLAGDDILRGEGGDDFLIGGPGADVLYGGAEGDEGDAVSYIESIAGVSVNLQTGEVFSGGGSDADGDRLIDIENVQGTAFDDILIGNDKNNRLSGENSDDIVDGGAGADILDGGNGVDELTFERASASVTVRLKEGVATTVENGETVEDELVAAGENNSSFENITGSRFDDDLTGDIQANVIRGGEGNDTLLGEEGNDTLIGGAGADSFDGGEGIDTVDYSDSSEGVRVSFSRNTGGSSGGDAEGDSFADDPNNARTKTVENIVGSDFGDVLIGDGNNNTINPGLSNGDIDRVSTRGGSGDRLFVDYSQRDTGRGIQTFIDEDRDNKRIFRLQQDSDEILDAVNYQAQNLTIIGTRQDDQVIGEEGDDFLSTGDGDDNVQTGTGSDVVQVGDGDDVVVAQDRRGVIDSRFSGGEDFFLLDGGTGTDTVSVNLSARQEDITIESPDPTGGEPAANVVLRDGSAITSFEIFKDVVLGSGDDRFTQLGQVDNVIEGGFGSDVLDGGGGDDVLIGTRSLRTDAPDFDVNDEDVLTGGDGADEFRLVDLNNGDPLYVDRLFRQESTFARITDFNRDEGDFVRLADRARSQYSVRERDGSDAIFEGGEGGFGGNLIAVLEGVTDFDLDTDAVFGEEPAPDSVRSAIAADPPESSDTDEAPKTPSTQDITTQAESNGFVVNQNNDAAALLTQLLGDTDGFSNIRVKSTGDSRAFGTFQNDPFGLGSGIVLSTGKAEDAASINTEDGDFLAEETVSLNFEKLDGLTGSKNLTAVFRADLSGLNIDLRSLSITDSGNGGGGSGNFTGFDVDGIKLSSARVDNAEDINGVSGLDVFDFSPLGTVFDPGTQRSPVSSVDPVASPDLLGTINGFVNNGFATLDNFDANPFTNSGEGMMSLGDNGKLSFNLTEPITPDPNEPLFLYIGEGGNNEDAPEGEITVSNRRVGEGGLLSTDLGIKGADGDTTELEIEFTADGQPQDLVFQFAFASEEFVEFAGSEFNDIFELELNGFNLARLSDGTVASINTLALSPTGQFHPDFINNSAEAGPAREQTGLDGFTKVLTFSGPVIPNAENRLVIRVKDVNDGLLDSAIFLKAGTVASTPSLGVVIDDGDDGGDGVLNVSEDGLTDTFEIALSTVPTDVVTIMLSPDNQLNLGDGGGRPIVLTFTPENARTAQTVTVAATDDQIFEGTHSGAISFEISSNDANYDNFFVADRVAQILDNDVAPEVIVTDAGNLKTSEDGLSDSFEIALSTLPTNNVTIRIAPDPQLDFGNGANQGITLTFTPENALEPQRVTVAAVDDQVQEGTHTGQVTFTVESNDAAYDNFVLPEQSVEITDNDDAAGGTPSVGDLDGTNGFAIPGLAARDNSGLSLSNAGDVNNDGIDDFIIGSPGEQGSANPGTGESYVVFGRDDFSAQLDLNDLDGSNGFKVDGIANGDFAGFSVSGAGDFNGDGIEDVVIGARGRDVKGQADVGESYVLFGREGGFPAAVDVTQLDSSQGFIIEGITAGDEAGVSVSGAGDINGDQIDDIIVGLKSENQAAYVIFGQREPFPNRLNLSTIDGTNGIELVSLAPGNRDLALNVSAAGDVNADGIGDLIVGDIDIDEKGKAAVVFGRLGSFPGVINIDLLNGNNGFVLRGIGIGDSTGNAVSSAGDVNGDGVDDIIIGAPSVGGLGENDPQPNSGESYVVFGQRDGFPSAINLSDLNGTNGFTLQIDAVNHRLGISVSEAGDINGDGVDDLIVGADEGGTQGAGESFVVFGRRDGFAATLDVFNDIDDSNGLRITGKENRQLFGSAVSAAGDVNNDGVDDLLIGARKTNPGGKERAGESYVVFGNAAPVVDLNGTRAGIDTDSIFLVGAEPAVVGKDLTITDTNSENLVRAVVTIANLQDGDREILSADTSGTRIEATFQAGKLFLTGTDTVENYQQVLRTVTYNNISANPDNTPRQIEFVASDGEFISDLSTLATATLSIKLKSAVQELSDLDGSNGFTINGVSAEDFSGRSVSDAGDVDGDGIDDIIIGANGADPAGKSKAGESYVVFGRKEGFSASLELADLDGSNGFTLQGVKANDTRVSIAVSSAGDFNNDGIDDLIIGARDAGRDVFAAGESYVVFGQTEFTAEVALADLDGKNGFALEGFQRGFSGGSVSGVGDFDGDGFDDVLIGANSADPNARLNAGESYLIFGQAEGFSERLNLADLNGQNGFSIQGAVAGDLFGQSVSGGDFNGDGLADLIIGASAANPSGRMNAGKTYLIFGREDRSLTNLDLAQLDESEGIVFEGIDWNDLSGVSVDNAGDINGDGVDDLIIGARRGDVGDQSADEADDQQDAGESYVVFGNKSGFSGNVSLSDLNGHNGFTLQGINRLDESGGSVSGVGDVNGDGLDDLIIGAKNADPDNKDGAGESYVLFGRQDGFAATLSLQDIDSKDGFFIRGIDPDDGSGGAVSGAGDLNGDGFDDLIVGAQNADPGGRNDAGQSYVLFGNAAPEIDLNGDLPGVDRLAPAITADAGPTNVLDPDGLLIRDANSNFLARATVTLVNPLDGAAELLSATVAGTEIAASYDPLTQRLTMSGQDTLENYQQVLGTLTYEHQGGIPTLGVRQFEVVLDDGRNLNNVSGAAIASLEIKDAL